MFAEVNEKLFLMNYYKERIQILPNVWWKKTWKSVDYSVKTIPNLKHSKSKIIGIGAQHIMRASRHKKCAIHSKLPYASEWSLIKLLPDLDAIWQRQRESYNESTD
jgi:hypothetical protein